MAAPNVVSSNNPIKFNAIHAVLYAGSAGTGQTAKTWSAVSANTTAEQTFTVTGVLTTDYVYVNKPTAQAGLGIVGCRVSAADTVAVTFSNNTAGSITPTASEQYTVVVVRPAQSNVAMEGY